MTPTPEQTEAVDTAIRTRRSVRAFLPTPVPRETVEAILAVAARAPSGTNTQPWKAYVLTGAAKAELSCKIVAAYDDPAERARHSDEYAQVAFMQFHRIVTAHVGAPADEQVVCGMSLGWADPDAIENTLVTEREPVAAFVRFLA